MEKAATIMTIDEALEKTGFGKFNYFVIFFAGLTLYNVILESTGISFVLPVLECDLHLSYAQQGVLGAVTFIGIMSSSHLWGFLADTSGRKRIMRPALLMGFIITVFSSFSTNFETLAVMRFFSGVLLSAGSATVFAYLGEFHCQRYRNRALMAAAFINAFLSVFFPVLAWLLINQNWSFHVPYLNITYKPWRSFMLACGLPGFICSVLLFYLPESPKYLLSAGRQEEAIAALKKVYQMNSTGKTTSEEQDKRFDLKELIADEDTPIKSLPIDNNKNALCSIFLSMWHQTAPLFMREHLRKTFLASLLQFIIFFSAYGVYMWFPYILNKSMQYTQRYSDSKCLCDILQVTRSSNFSMDQNEVEAVCVERLEISTYQHTISLELIYVTTLLVISYLIGKFGRRPILFMNLLMCGICGILSLVVTLPLLAIYSFVVFLCCGMGTILVNGIVVDIFPTNLRAMAMCISLMAGRIGSVTGSNVLGALIDTHCAIALHSSAGALIVAGCLSLLLPKPKTPKNLKPNNC